jgi:hypothetical protein
MSNKKAIVDIAVACSAHQIPDWWSPVMGMLLHTNQSDQIEIGQIRTVSSALPDANKNNTIGHQKKRWSLTDVNRNEIINKGFLKGDADWVFWMDDDTVPPMDTIIHLINLGRPFVAGLYFLPRKPYNPIAYKRHQDSGLYAPIYKYPVGALFEVDSVGMGCTLIHRSVYEKIQEEHIVFEKYNGAIIPLHKSQVHYPFVTEHKKRKKPEVRNGVYKEQVIPQRDEDDRNFPFYLLEYGRTEDHHFCELAENVGIKPHIDTTITCEHWKHKATTYEDYAKELEEGEDML